MKELLTVVAMRFLRAFVAGAIANMTAFLMATKDISLVTDMNTWLLTLCIAGLTGGLMALDKLLRYE